jgi:hypothetical protein
MSQKPDEKGPYNKTQEYLFGPHSIKDMEQINSRTDIPTREFFEVLAYCNIFQKLGSEAAKNVKATCGELLISIKRAGRTEAVDVMKGSQAPKLQRLFMSNESMPTEVSEESHNDEK